MKLQVGTQSEQCFPSCHTIPLRLRFGSETRECIAVRQRGSSLIQKYKYVCVRVCVTQRCVHLYRDTYSDVNADAA